MSLILPTDNFSLILNHTTIFFDGQRQFEGVIKSTREITLHQSCRVVYKNKMLVYTSTGLDATFAYEVTDCRLLEIARFDSVMFHRKRVSLLSQNKINTENSVYSGSCTASHKQIFLCFGKYSKRTCFILDRPEGPLIASEESIFDHRHIKVASSRFNWLLCFWKINQILETSS